MTTLIMRMYRTADEAKAAKEALKADGCPGSAIDIIDQSAGDALAAIRAAGVYPSAQETCSRHIDGGGSLLVVRAPFGAARRAQVVLADLPGAEDAKSLTDGYIEATGTRRDYRPSVELLNSDLLFLSDGIMTPALTKPGWTASHFLGLKLLTDWRPTGGSLMSGTISERLGLPLLSSRQTARASLLSNGTPFSSALGLPLLSDDDKRR